MSLAETQQIFDILVRIDAILNNIDVKSEKIQREMPKTEQSLATFRQLERLALRWLILSRQMGLPPEVQRQIDFIMKLIVTIRMAQMSINMMMMSNPATALIGVAGIIGTAASMSGMLEGY